ncbi:MAG: sigma-70 family RNA polymerase sigma factor [Chloroflexi bacterium]|nr:sigma-70 family RNA polymerase sigma factor [Chloroflexota bacterium]
MRTGVAEQQGEAELTIESPEAGFAEEEALQHVDALYRTALRLTRNAADAEDLVQETYLRAFRFRDRFAAGSNLRAWLFKILTNTAISRFRHTSREAADTSLNEIEEFELYAHAADVRDVAEESAEDVALGVLLDIDVRNALEGLPEPFRMAVVLSDVEGFSYKEIAEMLEVPLGTVMSRLFRGRRMLRDRLDEYARSAAPRPEGSR